MQIERTTLPSFRATLAEAEQAYRCPPVDDLAVLGQLGAVDVAQIIAMRQGLTLIYADPARMLTPHGRVLLLHVIGLLRSTGAIVAMRESLISELATFAPKLAGQVQAAWQAHLSTQPLPELPRSPHGGKPSDSFGPVPGQADVTFARGIPTYPGQQPGRRLGDVMPRADQLQPYPLSPE